MNNVATRSISRLETHYLLTNIKGVMTYLLVLYHFISGNNNAGSGGELQSLPAWLLGLVGPVIFAILCAVPIFVFITGYSSKDPVSCRENAFSLYLIPYFLITAAMVTMNLLVGGFPLRFSPFEPLMQLWYLLSMFWWMLLLKDLTKIKGNLILAFVLMFTVGLTVNNVAMVYSTGLGTLMSLSRTLYFLPFLLIGFRFTLGDMGKIRRSSPLWGMLAGGIFVGGSVATVLWAHGNQRMTMSSLLILKGDRSYFTYLGNMDAWWKVNLTGTVLTAIFLLLSFCLLYLSLRFMPKKKIPFLTRVGDSALTVFCLHGLIVSPIASWIAPLGIVIAFFIGVAMAVPICYLLSLPVIHKNYSKFIFWIGDAIQRRS